jgi:2-iminobutanoate/2-iminopropanoate deaminase
MSDKTDRNPLASGPANGIQRPAKYAPVSTQHVTAGPYSPVIEVRPGRIIVISGQAGVGPSGELVTNDFDGQTRATMANCLTQLGAADCGFADVFKVTVYLTDLKNWPAFNVIYSDLMPEPLPARTAVGCALLSDFLVEIEMWAVKS